MKIGDLVRHIDQTGICDRGLIVKEYRYDILNGAVDVLWENGDICACYPDQLEVINEGR